jgi:uncharacterized RDD family membrane protein YckC
MQWFYKTDDREQGPVDQDELRRLRASNGLDDETPVWADGMMDWMPYGKVFASDAPAPSFGEPETDQSTVVCSQCGGVFSANYTLTVKGMVVCAGCKPFFLQRLKEGIDPTNSARLGGFWARGAARILDSVFLWFVSVFVMMPTMFLVAALPTVDESGDPSAAGCVIMLLFYVLQFGAMAAYEICFLRFKGATPGKLICRLRVVMADGAPLGWGRATGRFFGNMLTGMTFFVGYILAAFDQEKRALHDMICNTRVIRLS